MTTCRSSHAQDVGQLAKGFRRACWRSTNGPATANGRQAVFFRAPAKEWAPVDLFHEAEASPGSLVYVVNFIDHGFAFNAHHWDFSDSPEIGLYSPREKSMRKFAGSTTSSLGSPASSSCRPRCSTMPTGSTPPELVTIRAGRRAGGDARAPVTGVAATCAGFARVRPSRQAAIRSPTGRRPRSAGTSSVDGGMARCRQAPVSSRSAPRRYRFRLLRYRPTHSGEFYNVAVVLRRRRRVGSIDARFAPDLDRLACNSGR